jgi:hypothetical protein
VAKRARGPVEEHVLHRLAALLDGGQGDGPLRLDQAVEAVVVDHQLIADIEPASVVRLREERINAVNGHMNKPE